MKSPNYNKNLNLLKIRSTEQINKLDKIERDAIANFHGQIEKLNSYQQFFVIL